MKVYGDIASGNCYQIKLIASILDIEHEWIHVDILGGATGTAEFLEKNPNLVGEQLTVADISLYAIPMWRTRVDLIYRNILQYSGG
jgi:glutathione S-transferase